jgi:membrane associated rhomboid family serine protease
VVVDACERCHLVWFDPREAEVLPRKGEPALRPALSPAQAEALVRRQSNRDAGALIVEVPVGGAEHRTAILGVPGRVDELPHDRIPWLTWLLGSAIVGITVLLLVLGVANRGLAGLRSELRHWIDSWGFVPADPWRHGGLTLVVPFFLHASMLHAIGNAYFLALSGEVVEGLLGRGRYLLLLLAGTVAAHFVHAAFEAGSPIPAVGASGGISALFGWHVVALPHERLGFTFGTWWPSRDTSRVGWHLPRLFQVRVPVWVVFAVWFVLQWILLGTTNVAYGAHIGGALAGIGWAFVARVRATARPSRSE